MERTLSIIAFVLAVIFAFFAVVGDFNPDTNWIAWSLVAGWAGLLLDHLA